MTSTLSRSNHRPPHVCIQHPSNVSLPIPIKFVLLAIPFSRNAIPHISLLLNVTISFSYAYHNRTDPTFLYRTLDVTITSL